MSNQHVLKIHPAPLADLLSGAKTAEVRRNDRGFQVGDTVALREVNPFNDVWTGRPYPVRTISHIQTGYGLPDGMCVLSYAQAEQQETQSPMAKMAEGLRQKAADEWASHPSNPVNQEAQGAQAGEFQREDRYLVIKRKDLALLSPTDRDLALTLMGELSTIMATWNAPERQYLVIESDWPEYEPTWAAIQARVEGRAALATQPDVRGAEHDQ